MISPQLLAEMPGGYRGPTPDQDLVESPDLANQLQQQNQITAQNLPALQAQAQQQAMAAQKFQLGEAQKQAAISDPIQAVVGGNVLRQIQQSGQVQPPAQNLPPQYQGSATSQNPNIPGLQGGVPLQGGQIPQQQQQSQTPASDRLIQLSQQASSPTAPLYKQYGMDFSAQLPAAQSAAELELSKTLASPEWAEKIAQIGIKNTSAAQLQNEFRAENPAVNYLPDQGQKIMDAAFKANAPQTIFGGQMLDRAKLQALNQNLGMSAKPVADYYATKRAFNQAQDEYSQYQQDPNGPGVRGFQEGLIDKFVQSSINKPTTESQFDFLTSKFPGISNLVDNATGRLKTGSALSPEQTAGIMQALRQNSIGAANTLKDYTSNYLAKNKNVDPDLINISNAQTPDDIQKDIQDFQSRKYGSENTGSIPHPVTQADFDAIPKGSVYINTDGKRYTK